MRHQFLLLLLVVFAGVSYAQKVPQGPPPPPVIFKSPVASDIRTYTSSDDKFTIDFAGEVVTSEEIVGEISVRSYSTSRHGSRQTVTAYDFGSDQSEIDKAGFVKDLKSELLRGQRKSIFSEEPVEYDSGSGFEIHSGDSMTREFTRVVFTEDRVFRLSITVANVHFVNSDVLAAFEKEKKRFLDSFVYGPTETDKTPD